MKRRIIAAVSITALFLTAAPGAKPVYSAPPDVRILLIGSSLVRGVKPTLKRMYRQDGLKAKIKAFAPARWTLHDHAGSGRTASIIASQSWDVVLLAQNSSSGIGTSTIADVSVLDGLISAQGSASGLLMTWFDQEVPASEYHLLKGAPTGTTGYVPVAFALNIPLAPAGWAIRKVLLDIQQGNAIAQSLGLWKHNAHLGRDGRYLVGAVVYTTLTGNSPVGQWTPSSLAGPTAAYLQAVAADTVLIDPTQWNIIP